MRCTNLIDLSTIELGESDSGSWLQAMTLGTYHHPVHGPITFTPEVITQYAEGVNSRIRNADLDIDYDHKKYHGEAAGWVRKAEARNDGLWLFVEWTKSAYQKIKEGAYKYFSPEFVDKWIHPKTKQEHKHVLLGGAITNRPFLRDIATLSLSESHVEELMRKELAQLLNVSEDADEATILAKVQELQAAGTEGGDGGSEGASGEGENGGEVKPIASTRPAQSVGSSAKQSVAASETSPADDPIVKLQEERIQRLEAALRLSEVNAQVDKLNDPGRKFAIAPVMLDEVKALMLDVQSKQLSEQVYNLFDKITKEGLVELGERGHSDAETANASATKQFSDLVTAKMGAQQGLGYADACELVAAENPGLWDTYRNETMGFGGGN